MQVLPQKCLTMSWSTEISRLQAKTRQILSAFPRRDEVVCKADSRARLYVSALILVGIAHHPCIAKAPSDQQRHEASAR